MTANSTVERDRPPVTGAEIDFAGLHLLVDIWEADSLVDPDRIERSLRRAAEAAGATILHGHFHRFSSGPGVSGVLVLAESHISVHTWPAERFAAIDIYMCGKCDPRDALPVLETEFSGRMEVRECSRGRRQPGPDIVTIAP